MLKLRLSGEARSDLIDIRRYSLRQHGADVADAYLRAFGDAFALLQARPDAGRAESDLIEGLRSVMMRRHRIYYRAANDVILVVRILHHAQNARTALRA